MKKILLLKLTVIVLTAVNFVHAQMPSPTPEPKVSEEVLRQRKIDDEEREARRFKSMPVRLSRSFAKTEVENKFGNVWLIADYRADAAKPKIELKMQISEKCFAEPSEEEKNVMHTGTLELSGKQLSAPLKTGFNVGWNGEKEMIGCVKVESMKFQIADEDLSILRNTERMIFTWSYGKVEIKPEGLATMREFLDKEIPSLPKQAKVVENSPSFYDWFAGMFAFFQSGKA